MSKELIFSFLNEIFIQNHQGFVNPLNKNHFIANDLEKKKKINKREAELYNDLKIVQENIALTGGISLKIYDKFKYSINSVARELLGLYIWGSGLTYRCEKEDRVGVGASISQILEFPEDGVFSRPDYKNIFEITPHFERFDEGTVYQTDFIDGKLSIFRFFHQGHRNNLHVKTVNIQELLNKINIFIENYKQSYDSLIYNFPLTADEFNQKILKFNELFSTVCTIEVFTNHYNDLTIMLKFLKDPKSLGDEILKLTNDNNLKWSICPGMFSIVKKTEDSFLFFDLFVGRKILNNMDGPSYDVELDKNEPTFIMPQRDTEFSWPMIMMYLESCFK